MRTLADMTPQERADTVGMWAERGKIESKVDMHGQVTYPIRNII